jgi:hypothetical protein
LTLYIYRCPKCPAQVRLHNGPGGALDCMAEHAAWGHPGPFRMSLVPDCDSALLPLDTRGQPQLAPLKVEHLKAAGILLPETQDALEWLWRHRATNGMAGAFHKVGGRRCIDLVAFARITRERRT